MSSIQMIAIDLDDTLLRDDISVSDYTKQVLARALSRGVRIVIATGRMFQAARPWGEGHRPWRCAGDLLHRVHDRAL